MMFGNVMPMKCGRSRQKSSFLTHRLPTHDKTGHISTSEKNANREFINGHHKTSSSRRCRRNGIGSTRFR
jgi:hypothetical protein